MVRVLCCRSDRVLPRREDWVTPGEHVNVNLIASSVWSDHWFLGDHLYQLVFPVIGLSVYHAERDRDLPDVADLEGHEWFGSDLALESPCSYTDRNRPRHILIGARRTVDFYVIYSPRCFRIRLPALT